MTQIKTKIPAELEPAAVGGMVTDSKYVKDRVKNKTQEEVNADTEERVSKLEESVGTGGSVDERIAVEKNRAEQAESTLDGKIAAEKQRAEGVEGGLNTRLQTVEQLATISVGGGDIGIGTAADFESDDPEDLAKVPTIGAVLDHTDDEPTAGSDNLVESGGVYGIVEFVGGIGEKASYVDINTGYWGKGVKLETCPIGSTFSEENLEQIVAQALVKVDVTGKNYLIIDGIRNSSDSFYSWFVLDGSNKIIDGSYLPTSSNPSKLILDLTIYNGATIAYISYQYNKDIHIYYSENEPVVEKIKGIHTVENKVASLEDDTYNNIHKLLGPVNAGVAEHTVVGSLSYSGTGLNFADNKIGDSFNEQTSFTSCAAQGIEKIDIQDKKVVIIQGIRNANNSYYSWFIVDSNNIIIGGSNENYNTPSYLSIDTSVYTDASYLYVSRLYNPSGDIQVWYSDIIPFAEKPLNTAVENIISQGSRAVSAGSSSRIDMFVASGINAKKGDILVVETNSFCKRIVLRANLNSGNNEGVYITNSNKCTTVLLEDVELLYAAAYVEEAEGHAIAGAIKWKAYIIQSPINVYSEYLNNLQTEVISAKYAKEYTPSLFDENVFGFGSKYHGEGIGLVNLWQRPLYPKYTQSATCFDKYAFIISAGDYSCFYAIDLSIGKYLQYINVDDSNTSNHNNTAAFSSLKYEQSDEFPLMFCGDIHSADFTDGLKITAYRIYKDNATWKAKGLYNINLPSEYGEGKNGVACQAVVNQDKIYIIAKMNNDTTKIKVLQNPSNVSSDITLSDEDVIDEFVVNLSLGMIQDAFVYEGILYQVNDERIAAIDLSQKSLAGTANLPTNDISEYEGCFAYDNNLYVITINAARTIWVLQKVDFQQTSKLSVVSERPVGRYIGQCVYDSILKKPVYWNGSAWTDALGNILT